MMYLLPRSTRRPKEVHHVIMISIKSASLLLFLITVSPYIFFSIFPTFFPSLSTITLFPQISVFISPGSSWGLDGPSGYDLLSFMMG
jgi:hypothetical protein